MRATLQFALRSLLARRGRSALLASAIAFATALIVAMACGIATAQQNIDARIDRLIGSVHARVVHQFSQTFEAEVVDTIRALPGVEAAGARLIGSLTLVHADGRRGDDGRVIRATVQARGIDLDGDPRLTPLPLLEGRAPRNGAEIVIDPTTQRLLKATIGDRLEVQRLGDPIELEVVGIFDRPALGALQRPMVHVDRSTLAEASDRGDEVSVVAIILRDGIDVEAWCETHSDAVREPLVLEPAERVKAGLDRQAAGSALGFTLACVVGFLGCAFIVGTGLTTALAEQVRELAMLRALGAGRWHLVASQLSAGGLLGVAGVCAGLPLGIAVTAAGAFWYRHLLPVGLVLSVTGILVAVAGAVVSGVLGASFAAASASRVTPLEALRIQAKPPAAGIVVRLALIGVGLIGLQSLLLLIPDRDARFWMYVLLGQPALFIAWLLLSVLVLRGVARSVAPLLDRALRLPLGALRGAVETSPIRLGLTAGALMVGMAILVSVWGNGLGLMREVVERVRFADAFVFKTTGLSPAAQDELRAIPGVRTAVPIGYLPVRVIGEQVFGAPGLGPQNVTCIGFEPESFFELNRIEWIEGEPATALPKLREGNAVLVASEFLNARGYRVGDTITLGGPRRQHDFEIVGVVSSAGLDVVTQFFGIRSVYMEQAVSCVFMDFDAVARWFDSRDAFIMQMDLGPDASVETEARIAEEVSERVPGAVFSSGRMIKHAVTQIGRTALAVSSGVAFAALLLATFGMANVVAAGISARRREFGVLRAIGGSRGVIARLVLGEVMLVGITAIVSGTLLGLHLTWLGTLLYRDMAGLNIEFVIPWLQGAIGAVALLIVIGAAALLPLRGASRQTPRELLSTA
ncbi:MAG: ABC transporter permease [Phycisphaeraceae bacterium]|nr:ABC transporter permease [Phycisphaeraceae bacterium]